MLIEFSIKLFQQDKLNYLEAALDVATHRVVVNRPRKAPPIAGPAPHHTLTGKTSRYDMYVHRGLAR